jgi:signal transduction histidine kinase
VSGALTLVSAEPTRHYEASDVTFAQQVADRVAFAVDNARLFRATREAEERQSRLVRELERAVRFSELFAGILGHDLRNPLQSITTAASLVLRGAESDRVVKPVSRILSSADRMARMIDQLLDFTHVRLGRGIPLHRATVDLRDVCRTVLDELKTEAGAADVELHVRGDPVGTWDEDRLAQLVSNLAGNAVQHRRPGTPVVLSVDGSAPDHVTLEVRNEGDIAPEILPVIFEPLRGGGEQRRSQGSSGLGLGLYISQQIVVAHGGTIRAESSEGHTRFTADVPRTPPVEAEQVFCAHEGERRPM